MNIPNMIAWVKYESKIVMNELNKGNSKLYSSHKGKTFKNLLLMNTISGSSYNCSTAYCKFKLMIHNSQ